MKTKNNNTNTGNASATKVMVPIKVADEAISNFAVGVMLGNEKCLEILRPYILDTPPGQCDAFMMSLGSAISLPKVLRDRMKKDLKDMPFSAAYFSLMDKIVDALGIDKFC